MSSRNNARFPRLLVEIVFLKAFDMISILSNASVTLSIPRRANMKHTLNKDVKGLCDPTRQAS